MTELMKMKPGEITAEIMAKYGPRAEASPAEKAAALKDLSDAVAKGIRDAEAAAEAERVAADAEVENWLGKAYPTCPKRSEPTEQQNIQKLQLEAGRAWSRGERWESTELYPSFDWRAYQAHMEAKKAAKEKK